MFHRLRVRTVFAAFLLLPVLTGCGDGSDESVTRFGDADSTHPGRESFANHELRTKESAIPLGLVQHVNVDDVERDGASFTEPAGKSVTDPAALYAKFKAYPGGVYTSREYAAPSLLSRDACLERCEKDSTCGSVVYMHILGVCSMRGPNMPYYSFSSSPLYSDSGPLATDSYVYNGRMDNTEYALISYGIGVETGKFGLNGQMHVKFLYNDKTASQWYLVGGGVDSYAGFGQGFSFPLKYVEAIAFSISGSERSSITSMSNDYQNFNNEVAPLDQFYNASQRYPWVQWQFLVTNAGDDYYRYGLTIDPDCERDSTDTCTRSLVFPNNRSGSTWVLDENYAEIAAWKKQYRY